MAFICDGCYGWGFGAHDCRRSVLQPGANYPTRCECATETSCASWVPAEILAPWVTAWGSDPSRLLLKTHNWVPDSTEPWCDKCGCTITAAVAAKKKCGT